MTFLSLIIPCYNEEEILSLYKSVGWINYTDNPKMLEDAYANSLRILGAYENEKLLGIIRVVGDGHSVVFIQDILVILNNLILFFLVLIIC